MHAITGHLQRKKTGIGTDLTGGFPDNTGEIQVICRDGSAFSRTPHGEERASARVSNHGRLAPLSPVARPSAFALRATADKSRRRCAPSSGRGRGRGMAGFVVNNNESTRPLSCKRPTLSAPGAIPTVDFLLHHPAAAVKKVAVKTHDRVRG